MKRLLVTYAVNDERITLPDWAGWDLRYVRTGIGKVKSAMRLTDAFHSYCPDAVLNVGTAGTVIHQVGDIFVCARFIDRDFQKIQLPGLDFDQDLTALLDAKGYIAGLKPTGICNTGDSFLTEVTDIQGDVFDMEAYAQALVCIDKQIPFLSVKYVTDIIGQNSVKHWEDKLAHAREGLELYFSELPG